MEANQGSLKRLLMDVRKMRRSVKLRGETDPEVVAQTLDTILKEAITLRSFNSGGIGRSAVNEMRNIRRDLIANRIKTGDKTGEFVGKYSIVLDQIDKIERESSEDSGDSVVSGIKDSIANSLPSADALTAALMTANPVLGYTVKMGRDLFNARKRAKQQVKSRQDDRIAQLAQEEKKTKEDIEETSTSGSLSDDQNQLLIKLEMIREEIEILSKVMQKDHDTNLEQVSDTKSANDVLERVAVDSESTKENLEKITKIEETRLRKERSDKGKKRLIEREAEFESKSNSMTSALLGKDNQSTQKALGINTETFGLFSGLGGAIGGLASKILKPIGFVLSFFAKASVVFIKYAAIGTVLVGVVNAIGSFFEGLFTASKILGKDEEAVTILDRVRAALTAALAGFLSPINWLLDKVGLGFAEDQVDIQNKLLVIQDRIGEWISSIFNGVGKYFTIDYYKDNILPKIVSIYNSFTETISEGVEFIKDKIADFSWTSAVKQIEDGIKTIIEDISNIFSNVFKSVSTWIENKFNSILGWFKTDDSKDKKESEKIGEDKKQGFFDGIGNLFNNSLDHLTGSSTQNARNTREMLEDRSSGVANSLYGTNQTLNNLHSEAMKNSPYPSVIAPSNVTNVNNSYFQPSTGSRNTDPSLSRNRRIYMAQ